jgi:hypothetical protein
MLTDHIFEYTRTLKKLEAISSRSLGLLYRVASQRVGDFDPNDLSYVLRPEYAKTLDDLHELIRGDAAGGSANFATEDGVSWHEQFANEFEPMTILEETVDDFVRLRNQSSGSEDDAADDGDSANDDYAVVVADEEATGAAAPRRALHAAVPTNRGRAKSRVRRNHTGGLLVAIKPSGRTSRVDPSKLGDGKQMRGCCIHLVGGARGNCSLTAARRKQVREAHGASLGGDGVRCKYHIKNWKAIGKRTHGC